MRMADVCLWHLADNQTAPSFVRFWTKADNGRFWPAIFCPLMTQSGHGRPLRRPPQLGRPGMLGELSGPCIWASKKSGKSLPFTRQFGIYPGNPGLVYNNNLGRK
jgi:hypothetical protein